jgi:nitrate reductase NapD
MNVSSLVIRTAPADTAAVLDRLRGVERCEVHLHDDQGRIIVTIEANDANDEMKTVRAIQALPHVLSAELAYAYSEEELDEALRDIDRKGDPVPGRLRE